MSYLTRAMKARDPRFRRIFGKMGYDTKVEEAAPVEAAAPPAPVAADVDYLAALRAEYSDVVGKKPFHGWDAETLREKIADAQAGD